MTEDRTQAIASARARKALALADKLTELDVDAELAAQINDETWAAVAVQAGVRPPSAETQALVVDLLARREREAGTDPFEGL